MACRKATTDDGRKTGGVGGAAGASPREGQFLLGSPTFEEMDNGRFRCVETGHELSSRDMMENYGRSKGCRLALIDAALARKTPPLNMFKPDPLSMSKLICKLTGDTINKSEEHIWKHINGKRFQKQLNQKEAEMSAEMSSLNRVIEKNAKKDRNNTGKVAADELAGKNAKRSGKLSNSKEKIIKNNEAEDTSGHGLISSELNTESSDSEEPDFWVPPIGNRWDFDNGKDRWETNMISGPETDACNDEADAKDDTGTQDLTLRAKRMSLAVGPSSFASRKKKSKRCMED